MLFRFRLSPAHGAQLKPLTQNLRAALARLEIVDGARGRCGCSSQPSSKGLNPPSARPLRVTAAAASCSSALAINLNWMVHPHAPGGVQSTTKGDARQIVKAGDPTLRKVGSGILHVSCEWAATSQIGVSMMGIYSFPAGLPCPPSKRNYTAPFGYGRVASRSANGAS